MKASELPRPDRAELEALKAMPDSAIDTSDIPQRTEPAYRATRDAQGHLPRPGSSPLRQAILAELRRRRMSGHQLWKAAAGFCATLPESAVYEFLSGKRQVGLAYLDAMLAALDLKVRPAPRRRSA
jgi:hypothetical protein